MCAQAESLSLVYCRHPDSSLVGDYRMSGDTTHAVNPSTCFIPRVRYVHSWVAPRFKTCFGRWHTHTHQQMAPWLGSRGKYRVGLIWSFCWFTVSSFCTDYTFATIIYHYLSCTHAHKLPLWQERMQLHLVCHRFDAGTLKQLLDLLHAEVWDAQVPY